MSKPEKPSKPNKPSKGIASNEPTVKEEDEK